MNEQIGENFIKKQLMKKHAKRLHNKVFLNLTYSVNFENLETGIPSWATSFFRFILIIYLLKQAFKSNLRISLQEKGYLSEKLSIIFFLLHQD